MKRIMENHILRAENENESQIKRYFDQEKEYINSGHKNFEINLYKYKTDALPTFVETEEDGFKNFDQGPVEDEAQWFAANENATDQEPVEETSEVIEDVATGAGIEMVGLTRLGKHQLETIKSGALKLNILGFENDLQKREEFYKSDSDLICDMWLEDAIILEGSLKHLEIIQDSLSDKLPKIIHFEIFYSTKIFVQQELTNALLEEWKQNKDIMVSNESQRQKRRKLQNDIEKFDHALEIISEMTKIIKIIQKQETPLQHQQNQHAGDYEEDMDNKHLLFQKNSSSLTPSDESSWTLTN